MVTSTKTTTRPIITPETELDREFGTTPIANKKLEYQEKAPTSSTIVYIALAIAVLAGGYYLYASAPPSTTVTSAITKTDMAPVANAPATSTTVVPATPMATTPPASTTQVPATPPAAGTAPAPATTTTP